MKRTRTVSPLRGLFALAFIVLCAPAEADTIFSNFGTAYPYTVAGWPFGDWRGPSIAKSFVPDVDYYLDSIEVYAGHGEYDPSPNHLRLYLAAGDITPGAEIESYSFVNLPPPSWGPWPMPVTMATSELHSLLRGGSKYWVVLATDPNAHMVWMSNGANSLGEMAYRDFAGIWASEYHVEAPALAVYGTPVPTPEPSFVVPLGLSLAGLAYWRCRRAARNSPLS